MTSPLLSADAPKRPRRSWTLAEQAAYVADFAASGLSATAFCRRLGIRRATLARWRERARATAGTAPGATSRRPTRRRLQTGFAAVTVVPDAVAASSTRQTPTTGAGAGAGAGAFTLVLRAPSGVAADVTGLDLATAAALLRAVLTPVGAAGDVGMEALG